MGLFNFLRKNKKSSSGVADSAEENNAIKTNIKKNSEFVLSRVIFKDGYVSPSGGYSNSAVFEIQGRNPETGRMNKRKISARTEREAIENAERQYGFTDISAKCIPFNPPTQAQLELSKKLRLHIPDSATKEDVSCMIGRMVESAVDVDDPEFVPLEGCSQEWADYLYDDGLMFSAYISMQDAYRLAEQCLSPKKKCKFYAYCVWCHFNKELIDAPFNHPMEWLFDSFSDAYFQDTEFLKLLSNASFYHIHGNEKPAKIVKQFMDSKCSK